MLIRLIWKFLPLLLVIKTVRQLMSRNNREEGEVFQNRPRFGHGRMRRCRIRLQLHAVAMAVTLHRAYRSMEQLLIGSFNLA